MTDGRMASSASGGIHLWAQPAQQVIFYLTSSGCVGLGKIRKSPASQLILSSRLNRISLQNEEAAVTEASVEDKDVEEKDVEMAVKTDQEEQEKKAEESNDDQGKIGQ